MEFSIFFHDSPSPSYGVSLPAYGDDTAAFFAFLPLNALIRRAFTVMSFPFTTILEKQGESLPWGE